jgi:hypothetical protein
MYNGPTLRPLTVVLGLAVALTREKSETSGEQSAVEHDPWAQTGRWVAACLLGLKSAAYGDSHLNAAEARRQAFEITVYSMESPIV